MTAIQSEIRYRVLGPLSVVRGGRDVTPTTPKLQALLTLLLVRHNRVVQVGELIDELWGGAPPRSAASTVQTYVYKLRRVLADDEVLHTRPQGYQLSVVREHLDLCLFEGLSERGTALLEQGDLEGARDALSEALSFWRGPALGRAAARSVLGAHALRLEEQRLDVLERRLETELRLGRHHEVLGELRSLNSTHPTHDGLTMKLITALHRSGLTDEAGQVFRTVQRLLEQDLGLEPSAALRRLYLSLGGENGGPVRVEDRRGETPGPTPTTSRAEDGPPAEGAPDGLRLPPVPAHFTGRRGENGRSVGHLLRHGEAAAAVPILAITGMPGVGKTALAVHIAHKIRKRFRGGTLFVSLRRPDGSRVDAAQALAWMLVELGVPPERVPARREERVTLLRTTIEGRRTLLVLDDVAGSEEARLLLPGCPRSAVIVTSRSAMYGLAGARGLRLDGLSRDESARLLGRLLGGTRVPWDRPAAEQIARSCGGNPLALHCAAQRMAGPPGESMPAFAGRLAGATRPLDVLSREGRDLRAGYEEAYLRLPEEARSALRALGALPVDRCTTGEAASVLGCGEDAADGVLAQLVEHHFVRSSVGFPFGAHRYEFAPFALDFAREFVDQAEWLYRE